MTMPLVYYPDPVLRQSLQEVPAITEEIKKLIADMFETMYETLGVGLAANQVGVPYRLFVTNITGDREHKEMERIYINPKILSVEGTQTDPEGCLSFPGIRLELTRAKRVRIRAQNVQGEWLEETLEDLGARALQHETDHVDGLMILNRMSPADKVKFGRELKRLERDYFAQQGASRQWKKTILRSMK